MGMKLKLAVLILSSVIAVYAIAGGLLPRYGVIASNDPYSQMTIFHEVLTRIVEDYVDEPDLEKVRIGALRGLAEGLDPYSAYLTPDQVRHFRPMESGYAGEFGMTLSKVAGYAYVVSVLKGSPAEAAGIQAGDVIEYVNGRATRDMSLYDAVEVLRRSGKKDVTLKLFRRGRSETITLHPGPVTQPDPIGKILEPGVGYLQVLSLAPGQPAKVRATLLDLMNRGAKRLVLDLRGTADGQLAQGVEVANLFIEEGTLAEELGKEGQVVRQFPARRDQRVFNGPLAVLVDRTTANAAEVVAAAILENKRGDVVGERTFGVGGEQELFRLRDGGGLLITTRKYASPSGKPFMGATSATSGVMPNVEVRRTDLAELPTPEELEEEGLPQEEGAPRVEKPSQEDHQLKKALELLRRAKR